MATSSSPTSPGGPGFAAKESPTKSTALLIALVVVIVVMVGAVATVLAYVILNGLGGPPSMIPVIALDRPISCGSACWTLSVASASPAEPLHDYAVVLSAGGEGARRYGLHPGTIGSDSNFTLNFTDTPLVDVLNEGDAFKLDNPGAHGMCILQIEWVPTENVVSKTSWAC